MVNDNMSIYENRSEISLGLDLSQLPQLIAFDLDYTVWPFYVDCHISGVPFTLNKRNQLQDNSGYIIKTYKDIPTVIHFLKLYCPNIKLALASRTPEPVLAKGIIDNLELFYDEIAVEDLAKQLLSNPNKSAASDLPTKFVNNFASVQLYPGNKLPHFRHIQKDTGIDYKAMMFFDDEPRNVREVAELGVYTVFVPDVGFTVKLFKQSILKFSRKQD